MQYFIRVLIVGQSTCLPVTRMKRVNNSEKCFVLTWFPINLDHSVLKNLICFHNLEEIFPKIGD